MDLDRTHRREFLGIAPTNKKVSVAGITIHQIAAEKFSIPRLSGIRLACLRNWASNYP